MSIPKYDKAAPFNDPIVRCDSCHKVVVRQHLHIMGSCPYCGNRKVRNVLTMTEEEMHQLKKWQVDPEFIALFEGIELPSPESLVKEAE